MTAFTLDLSSVVDLTDEQFYELCRRNRDIQFELSAQGELIIMPPTGWETGNRKAELTFQVQAWSRKTKLGKAFDSSTGFTLPNGAKRSPDVSWVSQGRLDATPCPPGNFLPLSPDFVLELRSESDTLTALQAKIREYLANGTRLGWLIDPKQNIAEIYRLDQSPQRLNAPMQLSGEDILPGLIVDLTEIFSAL